jgi:precorrin-8X/cobalt-precorrin-8 methylmutase
MSTTDKNATDKNATDNAVGILIISHGSRLAEANQRFVDMVERVAARLQGAEILPAFFSIVRPDIPDQIAALTSRQLRRIVLMPYFLHTGRHITVHIPELLEECRRQFPQITLELLPTLQGDCSLEDMLVERLVPFSPSPATPSNGAAIERESFAIIDRQLGDWSRSDSGVRRIVRRVVHATADPSFARTMRIHPEAIERGRAALATGKPIICDVKMLQAGMTKVDNEILCAIDQAEVAALAYGKGCTRAAAAMELLAPHLAGAVVAIGNAPTALWKILEMARNGGPRPALVVGLPVGFVGARESKLALAESDLCYITNTSARGGSAVAAAAVNALATLAEEE